MIQRDLKGKSIEDALIWEPEEGVRLQPFYRQEDFDAPPSPLSVPGDWAVVQAISGDSPQAARQHVSTALKGGADTLYFSGTVHPDSVEGLPALDPEAWKELLEDTTANILLRLRDTEARATEYLLGALRSAAAASSLSLLADPIAAWTSAGSGDVERGITRLLDLVKSSDDTDERLLGVDLATAQEAGASHAQTIGVALATLSEYLARGTDHGLTPDKVASHLHLLLPVGTSYFLAIAQTRALRILIPQVLSAYEAPEAVPPITAETSLRMFTAYSPYTNMLRGTTSAAAAIIGGCDALIVRPFDALHSSAEDMGARVARNTQLILKHEVYLNHVADPAAGSYYIEEMTRQISRAAWSLFQKIESEGGLLEAYREGVIQQDVTDHAKKAADEVRERDRVLVGATHYPDVEESRLTEMRHARGGRMDLPSDIPASSNNLDPVERMERTRLSEEVEAIRLATERYAESIGDRPLAYLLPVGRRGIRSARATFARNFIGCGGFSIEEPVGFSTLSEAYSDLRDIRPDLVVLCSSDDAYADLTPELRSFLSDEGLDAAIVVAGYPKDQVQALKSSGVSAFVHLNANLPETLLQLQQLAGISQ